VTAEEEPSHETTNYLIQFNLGAKKCKDILNQIKDKLEITKKIGEPLELGRTQGEKFSAVAKYNNSNTIGLTENFTEGQFLSICVASQNLKPFFDNNTGEKNIVNINVHNFDPIMLVSRDDLRDNGLYAIEMRAFVDLET